MISHIPNKTVLIRADEMLLSTQLLIRRVVLFGRIANMPHNSLLRTAIFQPQSLCPNVLDGPRSRGRPRMTWTSAVAAFALQVTDGSHQTLEDILSGGGGSYAWKMAAKQHFAK